MFDVRLISLSRSNPLHRLAVIGGLLCVMTLSLGSTGCATNRTVGERENLWAQNVELQSEVERLRALLDRRDASIAALTARNDELLRNQNAAPTPTRDPFEGLQSGITSTVTDNEVTVRIPGDVLFSSGLVELQDPVKQALNQIAAIIQSEYPTQTIRVEGHTDTDPINRSGWDDNLELSLQRAAAVTRYLSDQGIPADQIQAAGYGQHRPLGTKELSRRVEIVVQLKD